MGLKEKVAEQQKTIEALRKALSKYGQCTKRCESTQSGGVMGCDCGHRAALKEVGK